MPTDVQIPSTDTLEGKKILGKSPHAIAWVDIETTGLFQDHLGRPDYTQDEILEVGMIVTDFDLDPIVGYHEVIGLTPKGANRIRADEYVRTMHKTSGLLKDAIGCEKTTQEVDFELDQILRANTAFEPGEFMLGGSGVGQFDFNVLRYHMPKFAKWFAYYPADIGVFRRLTKILSGGRQFVNDTAGSYGESKTHRAYDDVKAHLDEAKKYQEWLKNLA